eukprot:GFUD01021844.1.p1 GENE.GFUD01021844.1~~GFUD01021844.1.p1  ORF type:complete len:278 (+),score=32.08 GFUD01021844.1:109-942(+)
MVIKRPHQVVILSTSAQVRLQTQSAQNPLYKGTWDCLSQTVKKEGIFALYKGMGAPLVGVAPIFAISFMGFGIGKKIQQSSPDEALGPAQLAAAGFLSGFMTTVIMAPGERIKCLLQVQQAATGPPKYSGPADVVKSLDSKRGPTNIAKSAAATATRDAPASAAYFASYELIQRWLQGPDRQKLTVGTTLFAGGMAGVFNWVVAIPMDVCKNRLQAAPEGKYTGAMDVLSKLLKTEGPTALWKGATPIMLRSFPANAACFLGYEAAMFGLNQVAPNL